MSGGFISSLEELSPVSSPELLCGGGEYCYVCQEEGHETSECRSVRCHICGERSHIALHCSCMRNARPPIRKSAMDRLSNIEEFFLGSNVIILGAESSHPDGIHAAIESAGLKDQLLRVSESLTPPEFRIVFRSVLPAASFFKHFNTLSSEAAKTLQYESSSDLLRFEIDTSYRGTNYLVCVLTFLYSEESTIFQESLKLKDFHLISDNYHRQLTAKNNDQFELIPALKLSLHDKLKYFESRNEYDKLVIFFPTLQDLDIFYKWLSYANLHKEFSRLTNDVGIIGESSIFSQVKDLEKAPLAYSLLVDDISKKGFSEVITSSRICESNERDPAKLIGDSLMTQKPHSALCSLCFKMMSNNKSLSLLQIGMDIYPFSPGLNRKYVQYCIRPGGAVRSQMMDYDYKFKSNGELYYSFPPQYSDVSEEPEEKVLDEDETIRKFVSDLQEYKSRNPMVSNYIFIVHSNFIALPLLLKALSSSNKLVEFRKMCEGVVDLTTIVPFRKEIDKVGTGNRVVIIPSLDDIFLELAIPPRDIKDPPVISAMRMRECVFKVAGNNDIENLLKNVSIPGEKIFASERFYSQEICLGEPLHLKPLEKRTITVKKRNPPAGKDICFIASSDVIVVVEEFIKDDESYAFNLYNPFKSNTSLLENHHFGYVISSPWTVLCPSSLSFLPTSSIPFWVGLQVNGILPKQHNISVSREDIIFCGTFKQYSKSIKMKPSLIKCNYNIFLLSIKTDGDGSLLQVHLQRINKEVQGNSSHDFYYRPSTLHEQGNSRTYIDCPNQPCKYYKDAQRQTLYPVDMSFDRLKDTLFNYPNVILIGFNLAEILKVLIPKLSSTDNIVGACDLFWMLSSSLKPSTWKELTHAVREPTECNEVNKVSLESINRAWNGVPLNYHNFVASNCVSFKEFYGIRDCQIVIENSRVMPVFLKGESFATAYVNLSFHKFVVNSSELKSVQITLKPSSESLQILRILPINLPQIELKNEGYFQDENTGSWMYKDKAQGSHPGDPVSEITNAASDVVHFLKSQNSQILLVTVTCQIRQIFAEFLNKYALSDFEKLTNNVICGWADLISSFYFTNRQNSFIATDRKPQEALECLHEFYFNTPMKDNNHVRSLIKIAKTLPSLKVEKYLNVPKGKYLTFFLSVRMLTVEKKSFSDFLSAETLGVISCLTVHNMCGFTVPLVPPPNVCPESAANLHFVLTANNTYEYNGSKAKDCYSEQRAFTFFFQTIESEVSKVGAEGALIVTLTGKELAHLLSGIERNNFTRRFIESVKGVGDISSYLQDNLKLENVSTFDELQQFYVQNVDFNSQPEPNLFSSTPPNNLTRYVSSFARYLVNEEYSNLTHGLSSWYLNQLFIRSGLTEFLERVCDVVVSQSGILPAKCTMRIDARLKGFLFSNGSDEKMKILSLHTRTSIKATEETLIFFKNHSIPMTIENIDRYPISLIEGETVIGRAVAVKYTSKSTNSKNICKTSSKTFRKEPVPMNNENLSQITRAHKDENTDKPIFKGNALALGIQSIKTKYSIMTQDLLPLNIPDKQAVKMHEQKLNKSAHELDLTRFIVSRGEFSSILEAQKQCSPEKIKNTISQAVLSSSSTITSMPLQEKALRKRSVNEEALIDCDLLIEKPSKILKSQTKQDFENIPDSEMQGFDSLCLEPSFKPFLCSLISLWKTRDKKIDHETGDMLIFKLMAVGLNMDKMDKLVKEKKIIAVSEFQSCFFKEFLVLEDILGDSKSLLMEIAEAHYGLSLYSHPPEKLLSKDKETIITQSEDDVSSSSDFILKKGVKTFLPTLESVKWLKILKCIQNSNEAHFKYLSDHSGKKTIWRKNKILQLSDLERSDEGIAQAHGTICLFKSWNAFQDCFEGFVWKIESSDIILGFTCERHFFTCVLRESRVFMSKNNNVKVIGNPVRFAIHKSLSSEDNSPADFIASFGMLILNNPSYNVSAFSLTGREKNFGTFNKYCRSDSLETSYVERNSQRYAICKCKKKIVFRAIEQLFRSSEATLQIYKIAKSINFRYCMSVANMAEAKTKAITISDNRGTLMSIGTLSQIDCAIKVIESRLGPIEIVSTGE